MCMCGGNRQCHPLPPLHHRSRVLSVLGNKVAPCNLSKTEARRGIRYSLALYLRLRACWVTAYGLHLCPRLYIIVLLHHFIVSETCRGLSLHRLVRNGRHYSKSEMLAVASSAFFRMVWGRLQNILQIMGDPDSNMLLSMCHMSADLRWMS